MSSDISYADLRKWAKRLFAFASGVVVIVFGAYLLRFAPLLPISTETQAWGRFGDYVGGTTNPILAFLSFTALLLTLVLQGKQMENSSSQLAKSAAELVLSREALARSARAQEQAEKELGRQADAALDSARLTSINLLLEHYRGELAEMQSRAYVASDPALERQAFLEHRERALIDALEGLYTRLLAPSSS